jgi:hypothetical protein
MEDIRKKEEFSTTYYIKRCKAMLSEERISETYSPNP